MAGAQGTSTTESYQISDFHIGIIAGLGGRVKNFFAGDDEIIFIFVEDGESIALLEHAACPCRIGVDDRRDGPVRDLHGDHVVVHDINDAEQGGRDDQVV